MSVSTPRCLAATATLLAAGSLSLADGTAELSAYRATYTIHLGAPDGQRIGTVSVDLRSGRWRGREVFVMRSMSMTGGNVGTNLVIMDDADRRLLFKRSEGHDDSLAVAIDGATASFTRLPFAGAAEAGEAELPAALTDLLALEPTLAAGGFPASSDIHLLEGGMDARPTTVRVSPAAAVDGAPRWRAVVALERGTMTSTMTDRPPFALARVIAAGPARIYWTLLDWELLD